MNNFRNTFAQQHVVLPVIHVESADQARRNAELVRQAGCPGTFLINHGMPWQTLLEIHQQVSEEQAGWWIGVNCLDMRPEDVFAWLTDEVQGVWVDNAGIEEDRAEQHRANLIAEARTASGWSGLYFGGVAFKYQRSVTDLESAAKIASRYMDVVTTSGPGTGQAAAPEKIRAMRQALGGSPLAIASGITPENIGDYLEFADCFLVATGISRSFTELNETKLQRLLKEIEDQSAKAASSTEKYK